MNKPHAVAWGSLEMIPLPLEGRLGKLDSPAEQIPRPYSSYKSLHARIQAHEEASRSVVTDNRRSPLVGSHARTCFPDHQAMGIE